jgi:hypothetical protein
VIFLGFRNDEELNRFLADMIIPDAGVLPFVHPILLKKNFKERQEWFAAGFTLPPPVSLSQSGTEEGEGYVPTPTTGKEKKTLFKKSSPTKKNKGTESIAKEATPQDDTEPLPLAEGEGMIPTQGGVTTQGEDSQETIADEELQLAARPKTGGKKGGKTTKKKAHMPDFERESERNISEEMEPGVNSSENTQTTTAIF